MLDENTLPWLSHLEKTRQERIKVELEKQERARENLRKGKLPKRTAKRIIERSQKHVAWLALSDVNIAREKLQEQRFDVDNDSIHLPAGGRKMKTYGVEIIIEHRYIVQVQGEGEVDAANKALAFAMDNEKDLQALDYDGRVESVEECK
jgi:hypothetical protein